MSGAIAERYAAARSDSQLLLVALHVEEALALAYDAAAAGPLRGADRELAQRFGTHEREHAAALQTLLLGLTVPVRAHATQADVAELTAGAAPSLATLAALEQAALEGLQGLGARLEELELLRTVGMVMAGAAQHLVVLRGLLGQDLLPRTLPTG